MRRWTQWSKHRIVVRAVTTDGCHHKQWYLEAIAEALQIELPPHDLGMAP